MRRAILIKVSVLNREPMGMKPYDGLTVNIVARGFSAQPRADGDEATSGTLVQARGGTFQCSTASRWG